MSKRVYAIIQVSTGEVLFAVKDKASIDDEFFTAEYSIQLICIH